MGTVNQEKQLERIADALEEISTELSEMNLRIDSIDRELNKCISRTNSGNFLCITGNISTN